MRGAARLLPPLLALASCIAVPPPSWEVLGVELLLPEEASAMFGELDRLFDGTSVTVGPPGAGAADIRLVGELPGPRAGRMRCLPEFLGGCDGAVGVEDHRRWGLGPHDTGIELARTVAHEIGHAYGLDHEPASPVMRDPRLIRPWEPADFLPWEKDRLTQACR